MQNLKPYNNPFGSFSSQGKNKNKNNKKKKSPVVPENKLLFANSFMHISVFLLERSRKFSASAAVVLAPLSAHAGPSAQPPIGTSGNFPARVSAESISPNFPIFRSK